MGQDCNRGSKEVESSDIQTQLHSVRKQQGKNDDNNHLANN